MSEIEAMDEALAFVRRWVNRYAQPGGDRHILLAKIDLIAAGVPGLTQADFDRAANAAEKAIKLGNTLAVMLRVRGPVLPRERYDAVLDSGPTARPAVDVEGIARVLDEHRLAPIDEHRDWTCRCGVTIAVAGLGRDVRALTIRHQAQAVVEYLAGESRG